MKIVPKETRLDPPGICFLCESQPQREVGERVIDTDRVYSPLGATNLRGRKYVCERCAAEIAQLLAGKSV